jgi:FtsH-binding integral membrane protein
MQIPHVSAAKRLLPPLAVGVVIAFAFVGLYTSALHEPRPHGLRVAFLGAPALQRGLQQRLDVAVPGGFDLDRYGSATAARDAVLDQDVQGALIVTGARPELLVAEAAGPATSEAVPAALGSLPVSGGGRPRVEDLRPLPESDSRGLSTFFTIVGTTLSSLLFGVALFLTARDVSARARLAATVAFAAFAGLTVAFTVDTLVGALSGSFWGVAGLAALLALAVALPTAGLSRLIGPPGIAIAALVLLLFGMSSSGGPVGYQFLPDPYNTLSQAIPGGAALTAIRNTVYFDGAGTLVPIIVLVGWAAAGLVAELAAAGLPGLGRPPAQPAPSAPASAGHARAPAFERATAPAPRR